MRILVLGGTQFVGRAMVQEALNRDHELWLYHRGKTNPDIFLEASHILENRENLGTVLGQAPWAGQDWDWVLDCNGYLPRLVASAAEGLKGRFGAYAFVSTISVYDPQKALGLSPGIDEDYPLAQLTDPGTEEVTGETYGGLKVLCEQVLEGQVPQSSLIIRPGFVVGPHDHTLRFPYWLHRVQAGGSMVGPGTPDTPIQFIDARDLARFTLDAMEQGLRGPYNVTGPETPYTWNHVLETAAQVAGTSPQVQWSLAEQLATMGPKALPMVALGDEGQALMNVDVSKARAAGLSYTPLDSTIEDTLQWLANEEIDPSQTWGQDGQS